MSDDDKKGQTQEDEPAPVEELSPDERLALAEQAFFGNEDDEEDWDVDWDEEEDDLEDDDFDLSKLKPRPSATRLLLMAAVVFVSVYMLFSFREEIAYFFVDETPTDLGAAMDYRLRPDAEGQYRRARSLELNHNTYVKIEGLPVRMTLAPDTEKAFFQLEGVRIFVEQDIADMEKQALENEEGKPAVEALRTQSKRTLFEGQGRLIAFKEDREGVYSMLKDFYTSKYGMEFCSDLPESEFNRRTAELGRGGLVAYGNPDKLDFLEGSSGTDAALYDVDFPREDLEGFAVGSAGHLLRTSNGGIGWTPISVPTENGLYALAFSDDLTTGVVAGDEGTLLRTVDGGRTFTRPYPYLTQDLQAATFFPGGKVAFVTGAEGIILGTRDGGETWSPRPVLTNPDFQSVSTTAGGAVIAVGDDALMLRSTDGRSWVRPPVQTTATLYAVASRPGLTLAVGQSGTILRSEDDGVSWETLEVREVPGVELNHSLLDVAISPGGQNVAYVGRGGMLALSTDAARSNRALSSSHASGGVIESLHVDKHVLHGLRSALAIAGADDLRAVTWRDDNAIFSVGDEGWLLYSEDLGVTWKRRALFNQSSSRKLLQIVESTLALNVLPRALRLGRPVARAFAEISGLNLWRTRVPLDEPLDLRDIVFVTPNHGFIAGQIGTMLETRDGGKTWVKVDPGTIQSINALHLELGGPQPVVVFTGRFGMWGYWTQTQGWTKVPGKLSEVDFSGVALLRPPSPPTPLPAPVPEGAPLPEGAPVPPPAPVEAAPVDPAVYAPVFVGEDAELVTMNAKREVARPWRVRAKDVRAFSIAARPLPAGAFTTEVHLAIAVGSEGHMLRSVDRGYTFHVIPAGTTQNLNAIDIAPDASVAYAGGNGATLLRGTDSLRTWAPVALPDDVEGDVFGVVMDPKDTQRLLVAVGARILLSEDGGQTFSTVTLAPHPLYALSLGTDGTAVAVGALGTVLTSADRGKSWIPTVAGTQDLHAVYIDGQRIALAGEGGSIQISADRGKSWSGSTVPESPSLRGIYFMRDGKLAWVVGERGAVAKSSDGGQTWEAMPPASEKHLHGIFSRPENDVFWVVGGANTLFHSLDGKQWSLRTMLPARLHDVTFPTKPGPVGFAVGESGTLLKTHDMGDTWITRLSRTESTLRKIVFEPTGKEGIAVGEGGTVITTSREGESWKLDRTTFPGAFYAVDLMLDGERPRVLLAGSGGAAFVANFPELSGLRPIALPRQEDIRSMRYLEPLSKVIAVGGTREDPSTICEAGYILQAGVTPGSHWKYLLLAAIMIFFGLFSAFKLVRYLRILAR